MSNTGVPSRRAGAARGVLLGLLGLAAAAIGGWSALERLQPDRAAHLVSLVRLTRATLLEAVVPGAAPTMPAAKAAPAKRSVVVASLDTAKPVAVQAAAEAQPHAAVGATQPAAPVGAEAHTSAPTTGSGSAPAHHFADTSSKVPGGNGSVAADNDKPAPAKSTSPSFDIIRVAPGGTTVVAGRAAPGANVALLDNGHVIARTKADESGQFVAVPDKPLPVGGQELALREDQPGAAPIEGNTPALVVVPEQRRGRGRGPAGARAGPDASADGPVAFLAPPDAAPRLLSVPSDPVGQPGQVALRVVDYDAKGNIRFAGTARPGTIVRLYVDDRLIGEARADAQGRWGLAPDRPIDAGAHLLRADDVGADGKVLSRAELPFRRADFAANDLREGRVVVQPRQSLWRIARQIYGHGTRYTVIFAANRDQIRDPNLIYPGQVFALPAGNVPAR